MSIFNRNEVNFSGNSWLKKGLILAAAALVISVLAPVAVVPAGGRGVMTTFGHARDALYEPGLQLPKPCT
ncbi:MAG: hypothetical protein NT035_13390 [Burkholderiales bacterium]|nr:hypothetical protein [Burkholderiales bacterium]